MKKIFSSLLLLSAAFTPTLYAQSMMAQMIDYSLKELASQTPQDLADEVRSSTPQPLDYNKWLSSSDIKKLLEKKTHEIKLKVVNNGAAVIDDKEYPDIEMELRTDYNDLPLAQSMNAYWEVTGILDKNGKQLLLSGARFDEYVELGIINHENFAMPGEWSQQYWLESEPGYGDTIAVEGTATLSYPTGVEAILLDSASVGKSITLGGVKFTLLSIEKNTLNYIQEGRRDSAAKIRAMFLSKDNTQFGGVTTTGMNKKIYTAFIKYGEQVPKEVKEEIAASIDPMAKHQEMMYSAKLTGNVKRVIFYKPQGNKELKQDFRIKKVWSFEEE